MYKVITNNKLVYDKYENAEYIDGDFKDVLIKTRDYVHIGAKLSQHPLPASIRMMFSPVRSVVIKENEYDEKSNLLIESCIEKYDKTMGKRKPDYQNKDDYELLDLSLTDSAIKELADFIPQRR